MTFVVLELFGSTLVGIVLVGIVRVVIALVGIAPVGIGTVGITLVGIGTCTQVLTPCKSENIERISILHARNINFFYQCPLWATVLTDDSLFLFLRYLRCSH